VILAIESRKLQLDVYFDRAITTNIPDEVRSDLARHGTILVCGLVERSVELVIMEKVKQHTNPRIQSFIRGHFRRGANYNCETIAQLLDRFDVEWGRRFRIFMKTNDDLVQAVISAYELRNSIAHGGTGNRGLLGVRSSYFAAKTVVEGLEASTN
jgi:hypothetical protein